MGLTCRSIQPAFLKCCLLKIYSISLGGKKKLKCVGLICRWCRVWCLEHRAEFRFFCAKNQLHNLKQELTWDNNTKSQGHHEYEMKKKKKAVCKFTMLTCCSKLWALVWGKLKRLDILLPPRDLPSLLPWLPGIPMALVTWGSVNKPENTLQMCNAYFWKWRIIMAKIPF